MDDYDAENCNQGLPLPPTGGVPLDTAPLFPKRQRAGGQWPRRQLVLLWFELAALQQGNSHGLEKLRTHCHMIRSLPRFRRCSGQMKGGAPQAAANQN